MAENWSLRRYAIEANNEIGRTLPNTEAVREGLTKAVSAGLGGEELVDHADMTASRRRQRGVV